jgi:cysteine synthase B
VQHPSIESTLGNTPLVRLRRLNQGLAPGVTVLCKMEGDNPAGSVKDRPAFYMVQGAQERGDIQPGDRLIEATSGNTGIALAMVGAILGYRMTLITGRNLSWSLRKKGWRVPAIWHSKWKEKARGGF